MARKTTGITATNRSKKTASASEPAAVQVATEVPVNVPKNGKPAKLAPASLEEQIRRRAYELYLERRATAGAGSGDENQDWLSAEREIRSRRGSEDHYTA